MRHLLPRLRPGEEEVLVGGLPSRGLLGLPGAPGGQGGGGHMPLLPRALSVAQRRGRGGKRRRGEGSLQVAEEAVQEDEGGVSPQRNSGKRRLARLGFNEFILHVKPRGGGNPQRRDSSAVRQLLPRTPECTEPVNLLLLGTDRVINDLQPSLSHNCDSATGNEISCR